MALLSRAQAAAALGVSICSFDRLLRRPEGAALGMVRVGGRILFQPETIAAWIAARASAIATQGEAA